MLKGLLKLAIVLAIAFYFAGPWILTRMGEFLVVDDVEIEAADAVVVLSTGVDYLPRLMQAASLHRQGLAARVVINGNRKTDVHRDLEASGYVPRHPWHEGVVDVLEFLGVERGKVVPVSAEDAYDTVSEATMVGGALEGSGIRKLIITTSKFHTRRSGAIWGHLYPNEFELQVVAAENDPFQPDGWWHQGRQIKQVLAEYGAWMYFWGKRLTS